MDEFEDERPIKKSPVDTVQYEIQMLRYCCERVQELRVQRQRSDDERCEYNLAIEGFLLHYRNLIEFFSSRKVSTETNGGKNPPEKSDDLSLKKLAGDYGSLKEVIGEIEEDAAKVGKEYWKPLNKCLAHMTDSRHIEPRQKWLTAKMFNDLLPVIHRFEDACSLSRTAATTPIQSLSDANSTGSTTSSNALSIE